jgi:hypothetical protein
MCILTTKAPFTKLLECVTFGVLDCSEKARWVDHYVLRVPIQDIEALGVEISCRQAVPFDIVDLGGKVDDDLVKKLGKGLSYKWMAFD